MGQTVLPLTQISWKYLKEKKIGRFVRVLKGQYGTKHSVLDSCFKNNWSLEKGNSGQTVLWLIQFFNKFLTPKNVLSLLEKCISFFVKKKRSKLYLPDAVFNKHLSISFGGNLYKTLERTIWVKLHRPTNSSSTNVWEHPEIYEVRWKFVSGSWKRLT